MTKKHILVAVIVVALCVFSALVAYRSGLHSSRPDARARDTACVDFRQAGSHTGETGCVSGQILKVYNSRGGNTFLDFCTDYRSCPFTSVIFSSDRTKFGDLNALSGRRVEIRGPITVYGGRPEIIVRAPDQIREVGD